MMNLYVKFLEPNVSSTYERFEALMQFKKAGIPTIVWLTPILPFINDTEENIKGILDYCVQAGVKGIICFSMGVTMREGDREYFYHALDKYFPGMKNKYIRTYGNAYDCPSPNNDRLLDFLENILPDMALCIKQRNVLGICILSLKNMSKCRLRIF
mgnify:CR=1 FL=1